MTNLTEKWRKGELPEGNYWVKHDGVINELDNLEMALTNVDEVLDKVPSYDEFNILKKFMVSGINATNRIHKLEKLLKECKEYFDNMSPDFDSHDFDEIISKIDQVLANNKIQANTLACNKIQEKNNGR